MKIEKMFKLLILSLFLCSSIVYGMGKQSNSLNNNLILAARDGNIESVKTYLQSGANPNYQDKDGNTALMQAALSGDLDALSGDLDMVKTLLDYGALINIEDYRGKSVIDKLKNFKCNINKTTPDRKLIKKDLNEFLINDCTDITLDYLGSYTQILYDRILELLEQTQKERIEKRNKKIKEILHENDFGVPTKVLRDLIQEYADVVENEEVENSGENYLVERSQQDKKEEVVNSEENYDIDHGIDSEEQEHKEEVEKSWCVIS